MTTPQDQQADLPIDPVEPDPDEQAAAEIMAEIAQLNSAEGTEIDEPQPQPGEETPEPVAAPPEPAPPVQQTTPEAVAEPAPPITTTPPTDMAELQRLRAENERLAQQQTDAQIEQATRQYAQTIEAEGYQPEVARRIAEAERDAWRQQQTLKSQFDSQLASEKLRMESALKFGAQFGVDPNSLLGHQSPQAMEDAARDKQRIAQLEQQVKAETRASVPAQTFDNSRSSPTAMNSEDALLDSANSKAEWERTDAEKAAMKRAIGF